MIGRDRETRGVSRVAVLVIALLLAAVITWQLTRQEGGAPRDEVADLGAAPAPAPVAPVATSPTPSKTAPAADAPTHDTGTSPPAATPPAPTSSGIDVKSNPAPTVTPTGGSAAPSPPTGISGDAQDGEAAFPLYWRRCFRDPATEADYRVASDSSTAWSGSLSVRVSSQVASPRSPGAGVCQVFAATSVKGRRIRLTLHMRTLNAVPGAHMLFRAEGGDGRVLAFYNMEPRWVSGTRDWTAYTAVLDVPESASIVMFGGSLVNTGSLWIDDALIQIVGRDAGVTQGPPPAVQYNPVVDSAGLSRALQNPGFEQTQPLAR